MVKLAKASMAYAKIISSFKLIVKKANEKEGIKAKGLSIRA